MDNRKPYVIFIDDEAFDRFWIDREKPLILGRTDINMEEEKRISRQQVEIKYNEENNLVMKQLGLNPSSITNRGSKEKTVTKRGETYPLKEGDIISLLCTKHEEKGKFRLHFPDPEDNSQPVTTDFEQTLAVSDLDILIDCIGDSQSQSRKNSSNLSSYMQRDIQDSVRNKINTNNNNTNVIEREVEHDNSVDKTIDNDSQKNKQNERSDSNNNAREEKEMSVHEDEKINEQPVKNDINENQSKETNENANINDNKTELMQVEEVKLTGRKRKAPSKRQHRKKETTDEEANNNNNASEGDDDEDVNEYSDGEGSPDTRHKRKRQRIDRLAENLKNLNEKTENELEAKNNSNNDNKNNEENHVENNKEDNHENRDFSKEIASVKLLMPQSSDGDILKALIMSKGSVDIAIQRLLEDELAAKRGLAKTSENIANDEQQNDGDKVVVKKTDSDLARELQREFEAEEEETRKKIEEEDQRLAEQLWKEEQAKKQKEKEEKEKQDEKKDVQDKPAVANNNEAKVENKAVQPVEDKKIITEQVKFPSYWSDQEEPLQIVNLDQNSDEFQSVCDRFMSTMAVNGNVTVTKIERIQNKRLWKWYYLKRDEIAKSNNNNAKETYLFHGTASNNMPIITKDGLDFRVANLNGAIGAGIYFAEQSSVSMGYVTASFGQTPRMFLCRVALGSVTNGYSGLRVPPSIPGTDRMYDSVSSTLINGVNKIYCIFDNHQSYPEYIIYYNYNYANQFAF